MKKQKKKENPYRNEKWAEDLNVLMGQYTAAEMEIDPNYEESLERRCWLSDRLIDRTFVKINKILAKNPESVFKALGVAQVDSFDPVDKFLYDAYPECWGNDSFLWAMATTNKSKPKKTKVNKKKGASK